MDTEELLTSLGGWGCYQLLVYLSLCFVYMRGAWQVMVVIFIGADPGHECYIPEQTNTSDPMFVDKPCSLLVEHNGVNISQACNHGYTYGDQFDSTILTEFDLVCKKDYLVELSTTIYMIGNSLGAVFITLLSDRFGRKWVMLISLWLQGIMGVSVAFVDSYIWFTVLRFFVGFFNMGIALTAYVMVTEVFPARYRTRPSVGVNLCWSLGIMLLSLAAYFVRNWRHMELLITIPNFITFIYAWSLPESIPWLMSRRKVTQLKTTVTQAARANNITISDGLFTQLEEQLQQDQSRGQVATPEPLNTEVTAAESGQSQVVLTTTHNGAVSTHKYTVLDLFKTSKIRRYTLIMFYLWFVNSLGYFGILFSTPELHGNLYVNLAISGAAEIPACLLCMFVLEKTGRRRPLVFFMLLCGVMNIAAVFIPKTTESGANLEPLIIALAMIGKFGITGSYSTVYLMSAEIFPTVIRNQAVGFASFFENIGGIAAPFIVYGAKNLSQMPLVLFGVLTVLGGLLALCLPETHEHALPETIEDVEGHGKQPQDNTDMDNNSITHL